MSRYRYIELGAAYAGVAASNFNRSFANVRPPFDVWTETPTGGCPNFLTGAGGFLQTAFNGYTGLRISLSAMTLTWPTLPEGATVVTLRGIAYLGNRITIVIRAASITVTLERAPSSEEVNALVKPAGKYAGPCDSRNGTARNTCRATLAATAASTSGAAWYVEPLSDRSQLGREVLRLDGNKLYVVPPRALAVVDATGDPRPLQPGEPEVIAPRQSISIVDTW